MAKTATLTLRVSDETKSRLQAMAKRQDRSVAYVAEQAISDRLTIEEAQIRGIEEAIAEADRGALIDHSDIRTWVQSLDGDNPLPRPRRQSQTAHCHQPFTTGRLRPDRPQTSKACATAR